VRGLAGKDNYSPDWILAQPSTSLIAIDLVEDVPSVVRVGDRVE
jgi:hypothetical protein